MKKLCLLLAVIVAASLGCSEDKKNSTKSSTIAIKNETKIKTVDELFAAMEKEAKRYNEDYPAVFFTDCKVKRFNEKQKASNYTYKAISVIDDNVFHKGIVCYFYDQSDNYSFCSIGIPQNWILTPQYNLNKKFNFIKYVNTPEIITKKKTDAFKNFFKEIYLENTLEKINNKKCYKLVAITDKNNPTNMNIEYNYFIGCDSLKILKYNFAFYVYDNLYNDEIICTYTKDKEGKYHIETTTEITTPFNEDKPTCILKKEFKKIVGNVNFDENLLKCPKDENDYKQLQDYFNMLLKKYYDNKYQIKIK